MYKIVIEKQAQKFLEKHKGQDIIYKIIEVFDKIKNNPLDPCLDIRPMVGLNNTYRLRIGKYKVLYEIINQTVSISVFKIDSRGGIYK